MHSALIVFPSQKYVKIYLTIIVRKRSLLGPTKFPLCASEQGIYGPVLTVDSHGPLDPSCRHLSASLSGLEIGAERAENRVNGSGVVRGRGMMR